MGELTLNCPQCSQLLSVRDELLGQAVVCPSCRAQFTTPAESPQSSWLSAGPSALRATKDCPFCGEEILVQAKKCKHCGEFLEVPDVSTPIDEAPQGESEVWSGRPSVFHYLPLRILGLLLAALGLGLVFIVPTGSVLIVVGIWIVVYSFLDRTMRIYTVTSQRVVVKEGIISRKTAEVLLRDIRAVVMKQSVLERIFGLGTVSVGSAGTAGLEVVFAGLRSPAELRDLIRDAQR